MHCYKGRMHLADIRVAWITCPCHYIIVCRVRWVPD